MVGTRVGRVTAPNCNSGRDAPQPPWDAGRDRGNQTRLQSRRLDEAGGRQTLGKEAGRGPGAQGSAPERGLEIQVQLPPSPPSSSLCPIQIKPGEPGWSTGAKNGPGLCTDASSARPLSLATGLRRARHVPGTPAGGLDGGFEWADEASEPTLLPRPSPAPGPQLPEEASPACTAEPLALSTGGGNTWCDHRPLEEGGGRALGVPSRALIPLSGGEDTAGSPLCSPAPGRRPLRPHGRRLLWCGGEQIATQLVRAAAWQQPLPCHARGRRGHGPPDLPSVGGRWAGSG